MKTLLTIAAALAFLFPFVSGGGLLIAGLSSRSAQDFWLPVVLGSFMVGSAFVFGGILLVAAQNCRPVRRNS